MNIFRFNAKCKCGKINYYQLSWDRKKSKTWANCMFCDEPLVYVVITKKELRLERRKV